MLRRVKLFIFDSSPVDLRRSERVAIGLACLALIFGLLGSGLLRFVWPDLAVEIGLRHGDRLDPWGNPWVNDLKQGFAVCCHSRGPNGIDDDCRGDDILGIAGHLGFAIDERNPGKSLAWGMFAWVVAPRHFVGVAVLIGWFVAATRLWSVPRRTTLIETARAGVLGAVPVIATWIAVLWVGAWSRPSSLPGPLLVPAPIAVAGSISLVIYLAALGRRLSRDQGTDGRSDAR